MNLYNFNEIQTLLNRHNFRFSKSLGQNFLTSPWVSENIVIASKVDKSCGVLEIGPGIGSLTQQLCKQAGKVVSVELDTRLYPVLNETMSAFQNFTLVPSDIMKLDLSALVSQYFYGLRPIVCANLPFNITTPVLTRLVESSLFDSLTVLIQKEVAERICATPGTADYGTFTLLMQYYSDPQLCFQVPNTCFFPSPKVTSAVIHCPVRKNAPVSVNDTDAFWRTIRAGFALRRKTLVNSLQTGWNLPKSQLADIVASCGFDINIRGERLSLNDYATLTQALLMVKQTLHT